MNRRQPTSGFVFYNTFFKIEMKRYKITTTSKKLLADTTTPVSIYLRLRDVFPNSLLLKAPIITAAKTV